MARLKRMTNVQFIKELMEYSRHGAMSQVFILEAVRKEAEKFAALDPEILQKEWGGDSALISAYSWVAVAKEIEGAFKLRD